MNLGRTVAKESFFVKKSERPRPKKRNRLKEEGKGKAGKRGEKNIED